jgi:predicted component of type VI protein secretion system
VSIQRGYAARPATATLTEIDLSSFPAAAYIAPTHILFDGKAFELLDTPFEIGRSPARHGLKISEGLAGVSRLHCSLQTDESGVTLVPHSQQGTWLNDERVRGRVRVSSGDRLRIGVPGVIVELIAVGGADRAAPSQR